MTPTILQKSVGSDRGRIVFANQLRGLAAILVVFVHFTVVVQFMRPAVAYVIAAPSLDGPVSPLASIVRALPVDPAATGVSLFFLISGFVIPFALASTKPLSFLMARALRVFPTFWTALALEALAVHLSGLHWGRVSPFPVMSWIINGLLLQTALDRGSVDWISWTLSIEAKFYVLAAILRQIMLRGGIGFPICCALIALAINAAARAHVINLNAQLINEATYIAFILIGTMFHSHLTGRLSRRLLIVGIVINMLLCSLCWWHGPSPGEYVGRMRSFVAALAIFSVAYACRDRFRSVSVLNFVAAISYPLYLIHAVFGFSLLTLFVDAFGLPYGPAAAGALLICVATAYLMHRFVEQPTIRWGHLVARDEPGVFAHLSRRLSWSNRRKHRHISEADQTVWLRDDVKD